MLETLANIFSPDEFEEENIPEDSRDDLTGHDLPHFSLLINSVLATPIDWLILLLLLLVTLLLTTVALVIHFIKIKKNIGIFLQLPLSRR